MIGLAERLRSGRRGLGLSVLTLIGLTAAIIVGLLAMHSLNGHAETPGPTPSAQHSASVAPHDPLSASAQHADAHHATAGGASTAQPADPEGCPDCGHTGMLAMTCVLALLSVALLILLPRLGGGWRGRLRSAPMRAAVAATFSRPPSLLVLSISRT
jgi:hypothetical protein